MPLTAYLEMFLWGILVAAGLFFLTSLKPFLYCTCIKVRKHESQQIQPVLERCRQNTFNMRVYLSNKLLKYKIRLLIRSNLADINWIFLELFLQESF